MKEKLRCDYCDCEVEENWFFCPTCGTNLDKDSVHIKNYQGGKQCK